LQLVVRGPSLLALVIGAGLCMRHATHQRRRVLLVGIALGIYAFTFVLSFAFGYFFRLILDATDSPQIAQVVLGLMSTLPNAVALLLLFYAVFHGDEYPQRDELPGDDANS